VDVTVQRPFTYRDGDIVSGSGVIRHQNNSDYINCTDAKLWTFSQWRKQQYGEYAD
jgi:hypothetical protein